MVISPLVQNGLIMVSPNKSKRKIALNDIDGIAIHCMACNGNLRAIGNSFARKSTKASSNYGIDSKGNYACYVPEEYRSWCTSNTAWDNRSITIEVANDGDARTGWHVSDASLEALVKLLVDICQRYPKLNAGLRWKGDKNLVGKMDQQNMAVHRWFKNKACPGDYLYNLHGSIANEVNRRLGIHGVYIPPTPVVVKEVAKPTVKNGSKGPNAKLLQHNLNHFGCGLVEDGIFGKASTAALKAWQRAVGLSADGIYGAKSATKMNELI